MNLFYSETQIAEWREVFALPEVQSNGTSVFRGQSADWNLQPSLVRTLKDLEEPPELWLSDEYLLLKEFKRRAHLYQQDLPRDDDIVSWLALMQHHGTPTRLLDFSYSFFVACYFAFANSNAAVFSISDGWLRSAGTQIARGPKSEIRLREEELKTQYLHANRFLADVHLHHRGGGPGFDDLSKGVLMLEPERQIERLAIQQGLFLMPLNLHLPFLKNMDHNAASIESVSDDWKRSTKSYVKKIVFSKEARMEGLCALKNMNITGESLFPGIDGFARSLVHTVLAS